MVVPLLLTVEVGASGGASASEVTKLVNVEAMLGVRGETDDLESAKAQRAYVARQGGIAGVVSDS